MKDVKFTHVLSSGAGGGIAYWAYVVYRGGQPAAEHARFEPATWLWLSLVLTIILGAAAAFLMVYYVANTDLRQPMRALGFAAACGLCWDPVLSGVTDRFTKTYRDSDAAQQVATAREIAPGSAQQSPDKAAEAATNLLKVAPNVQNPLLQKQVADETTKLIDSVQTTADPAMKTQALQRIGVAAAAAGQPAALAQTVTALQAIADSHPEHTVQAREAIKEIRKHALSSRAVQ